MAGRTVRVPYGARRKRAKRVERAERETAMKNKRLRFLSRIYAIAMATALTAGIAPSAQAEGVVLPSSLKAIEANAYAGCSSIAAVEIPDGVTSLGASAFADCANLTTISIPQSVETMGDGCLSGCSPALIVRCASGSAAHEYALDHVLDYDADTVYRALLIGQLYPGTKSELKGPGNDIVAMDACLSAFGITQYQSVQKTNLTGQGILDTIVDTFGDATEDDVSLFFYSGHGVYSSSASLLGALVGTDSVYVTADVLRQQLDVIKGRKIVIVDACHSGALIGKNLTDTGEFASSAPAASTQAIASDAETFAENFPNAFISAFTSKARSNLATDGYYVITAAHSSQQSSDCPFPVNAQYTEFKYMGAFTYFFTKGCGWDGVLNTVSDKDADANGDGVITLQEGFVCARDNASQRAPDQTAQVYPTGCTNFGLFR